MKHAKQSQLLRYFFKLLPDSKLRQIEEHLAECELCRDELEAIRRRFGSLELLREEGITASDELISRTIDNIDAESGTIIRKTGKKSQGSGQSRRTLYVWGSHGRWAAAAAVLILVGGVFIIAQFPGSGDTRTSETSTSDIEDSKDQRHVYQTTPIGKLEKKGESSGEHARKGAREGDGADRGVKGRVDDVAGDGVGAGPGTKAEELLAANDVEKDWSYSDTHMGFARKKADESGVADGWGQCMQKEEQVAEKAPFAPASNIELVVLPRRDTVQLTIYNSADLTLVRETRNLTMKQGWNWLQFQWKNTLIDPTSLSLEPKQKRDQIRVEQLVFPPRLKDLGRWLIKSNVSGQVPFEITYLTSGLSWRAFYMGTLTSDEKTMRLTGYVRAENQSGDDYENAQTRLIVGKVHILDRIAELARRVHPYGRPGEWGWEEKVEGMKVPVLGDRPIIGHFFGYEKEGLDVKEIVKEGLSEYFLYTIEGTETIRNEYAKRLPSFEEDEVPVVNLYKYEQERYGDQVVRFLSFTNDQEHKLGDTPIPGGMLKVYRTEDSQGHLSYAGQSEFKYIPVNEEVELNLGSVQNVVVEPKLMGYRTENYEYDDHGNITGWDEVRTWTVTVKNTRAIPVQVEIKRNFQTTYWDIANRGAYGDYEKYDKDTVEYTLELRPQTKQQFQYEIRTYHGTREE